MSNPNSSSAITELPQYYNLQGYLDLSTCVLVRALNDFCKPVEDAFQSSSDIANVQDALSTTWNVVTNLASTTPHVYEREKLVDFIVNLTYRPSPEKNGQACVVEGMALWKDLPMFGWQMREAWNTTPSQSTEWINLNAWTCSLTVASHRYSISVLDFSLYGIWTIRAGLEEVGDFSDSAVAAAAQWLVHGASTLAGLAAQDKSFQGKIAQPGPLFKDRQWTGYSLDRWQSWERRLAEAWIPIKTPEIRELLSKAIEAISMVDVQLQLRECSD